MHENQLVYPALETEAEWSASRRRRAARRDEHYPYVNLTSMLASDVVLWNSDHNRRSFLDALPRFLRHFPDHREMASVALVAERSQVLPLGLDLRALGGARGAVQRRARRSGAPVVLWNHRWEHDKDPARFFAALRALSDRGPDFRLAVLGASFGAAPKVFEQARTAFADRIEHWGYADSRDAYARLLRACDIVVSTARHEFFGAAVAEATYCGCRPILPNALAYPELIPARYHDSVLYDGFDDLVDRLCRAIEAPEPDLCGELAAAMSRFDWQHMAPRYDELLLSLAEPGATARSARGDDRETRMESLT
jgi:glycosyltransferase involved in cell wall biosynthesis